MRGNWIGLAIGLLFAVGLAAAPVASAADSCDNATLREQNDSTELPDCRAYEMVSPSYKQGFDVFPGRGFSDGGLVSFESLGSFAGNVFGAPTLNFYRGVRTPAGWETQSLGPPQALYSLGFPTSLLFSGDLQSSVASFYPRDQSGGGLGLYVRDFDGGFTRVSQDPLPGSGTAPAPRLGSDDLSHVVFDRDPVPGLWEYVGVGAGAVARRVDVDNAGAASLPSGNGCANVISRDGRVIVFGSGCGGSALWARVGGSATVAVSGSECTRVLTDPGGVCNAFSPATLGGAAEDGSRVFFTTAQQLVNDDTDLTRDLYACDIPDGAPAPVGDANQCATLTEISGASDAARVENTVAVSDDGSRVYFTAQGVLADNIGTSGAPAVAGGQNLYLWTKDAEHPAGETKFVAGLNGSGIPGAKIAMGGRYLVFSTTTSLVSSGPGADTDDGAARLDVYRYDAQSETMLRLSTSVTGGGGNAQGFDAGVNLDVTADGSMVVFNTAEGLSPADTDGVSDVYLWHEDGRVSRISRGGGSPMGISSTGEDIYFTTKEQLTAVDGDVNADIYDARVGGGFDPTQPATCSGDACRGQQSGAPDLAGPSAGGDDGARGVTPVVSLRTVSAAQRKRLAATGKLSLAVSANTAGVVAVKATAKIAGRTSTVASGRRTISRPGTARVALTLSKKARKQLAARGRLAVRIVVSHSKTARSRSVTLRLAHAKAKGGRS